MNEKQIQALLSELAGHETEAMASARTMINQMRDCASGRLILYLGYRGSDLIQSAASAHATSYAAQIVEDYGADEAIARINAKIMSISEGRDVDRVHEEAGRELVIRLARVRDVISEHVRKAKT